MAATVGRTAVLKRSMQPSGPQRSRAQAAITEYQAACARWLEMQIREVDDLRAEKAREAAAGVVEVAR